MYNRWLVAFACAWINLFIFAVFRSSGVLYLSIIDNFHCSHQQAAWPVSLAGSVASTTGIFSSFFSHYISTRCLVIIGVCLCSLSVSATYFANSINFLTVCLGLIQGIGIGFVTNLLPAVLNAHFVEQKAIALGISYAGATLGAFIFPIIIQTLLVQYEFYDTMLLIGGLTLNGVVGAMLLRYPKNKNPSSANRTEVTESPEQQQTLKPLIDECNTIVYVQNNKLYDNIIQSDTNTKETDSHERTLSRFQKIWIPIKDNLKRDIKLLMNIHFVLCTFTYVNFILDFVSFIIILPDVAQDQGIKDIDSKWLLSIFSITDFVGRIAPGWLSYWNVITDKNTYIISITLLGLCMILLITVQSWLNFVLVSLLCGLVTGCQMVLSPAILADYLGTENTAVAFGMCNFLCGLLTLATRPLIIGIKDIYGNYNMLGYILSISALISSVSWMVEIIYTNIK